MSPFCSLSLCLLFVCLRCTLGFVCLSPFYLSPLSLSRCLTAAAALLLRCCLYLDISLMHACSAYVHCIAYRLFLFFSVFVCRYSSNLMTAVIVGRETLDELQSLAVSFFSRIPNNETPKPQFNECSLSYQPFAPQELKTLVSTPHGLGFRV